MSSPTPKPRAYTPAQVADLMQLRPRKVWDLIAEGRIAAIRVGRQWRIPDHELERLLHSADNVA